MPYEVGVRAAREVAGLTLHGATTAQLALRWIIDQPGVTTVIPGVSGPEHARNHAAAFALEPLAGAQLGALAEIFDRDIREHVHAHHGW